MSYKIYPAKQLPDFKYDVDEIYVKESTQGTLHIIAHIIFSIDGSKIDYIKGLTKYRYDKYFEFDYKDRSANGFTEAYIKSSIDKKSFKFYIYYQNYDYNTFYFTPKDIFEVYINMNKLTKI